MVFSHVRIIFTILVIASLIAVHGATLNTALAQSNATPPDEQSKPVIKTLPPAYNDKMLRLAEILGALHYLRDLCEAREGMLWREQMENVLAKEDPTPERKAALVARFNRGYRTYREIYRKCTSSAVEAVNLYMRQGTRLSGEIPNRYGR